MESAEPVPTEESVKHSNASSSGSSFLSDVQVPQDAVLSDSEWADDWAVEDNEHGVVPASTSSASASPEATHSPGEAEEAHAAAQPSLPMSSGEALETDEATTQPSCSTATQLNPAATPDGNATRHDTRAADGTTASCSSPRSPAVQNHPVPAETLPCSRPAAESRLGAAPMRSSEMSAATEAGPPAQPLNAGTQLPAQERAQPEAPASSSSSGGGNVGHAVPAATGSAWGWGASAWGLHVLGGRLQQVAAGRGLPRHPSACQRCLQTSSPRALFSIRCSGCMDCKRMLMLWCHSPCRKCAQSNPAKLYCLLPIAILLHRDCQGAAIQPR